MVLERCLPIYRGSDLFDDFPLQDEWHLNEYAKRGAGYLKAYCSDEKMRSRLMETMGRLQYRLENPSEAYRDDNAGWANASESISERAVFPTSFEPASTLIVIGNGFDLDHGMATGFGHFRRFLEDCNDRILAGLESIGEYVGVPPEEMWCDFEKYMEGLGSDYLNDYNAEMVRELVPYYSDDFRDRDNHTLEVLYDMDLFWIDSLKAAFYEWISSVELPNAKKYQIDATESLILNFNYTTTLEDVYGIPTSRMIHIHGTARTMDSLIMGHSSRLDPRELNASLGGDDARLRLAYDQCSDFLSKFYKPVESIAAKLDDCLEHYPCIEKIIVLGHSYNKIDQPYFRVIANKYRSAEFVFSVYSDDDLIRLERMMKGMPVREYRTIRSYRDVLDPAK